MFYIDMLSVTTLNAVMLNVVEPESIVPAECRIFVVILNVVIPNFISLNVVAPFQMLVANITKM